MAFLRVVDERTNVVMRICCCFFRETVVLIESLLLLSRKANEISNTSLLESGEQID